MPDLKARVKQCALDLGFDLVRVTTAEPFLRDERAAVERVRQGLMDGLPWYTEDRVRKANRPESLLEGAKSVVSLAVSYNTGDPEEDSALRGKVARYAWGDDYHELLKPRLRRFADALTPLAGREVRTRVFVDDGPMNDQGRRRALGPGLVRQEHQHTHAHARLVGVPRPGRDRPRACPGRPARQDVRQLRPLHRRLPHGAIVAPYVIDNRKCISFLTIELRGPIPRELRPLVGAWVFGCDICQDVCPVNRKARLGGEAAFRQRGRLRRPELIPLLELDEQGFRERFRGSPMKRAKLSGLKRNACVALGNLGAAAAVPALAMALAGDDALVRSHAAWALGRIGGAAAESALRAAHRTEPDADVAHEIALGLEDAASRGVDPQS